jgi:3-hydroxyacyl-[acyl-carrier-protein] dehydratase
MARSASLPFFADHFPGRPLMPGVLLIECAAQAAGALWASTLAANAPAHFILAQVMQFKIQQPVLAGRNDRDRGGARKQASANSRSSA